MNISSPWPCRLSSIVKLSFWLLFIVQRVSSSSSTPVQLRTKDSNHVVMDNGILQVTLSKPDGYVTHIKYKDIDNLLEVHNDEDDRGYWDIVWQKIHKGETFDISNYNDALNISYGNGDSIDRLRGANFSVIMANENQVEVSFSRTWSISLQKSTIPLNVDKRFIMRSGSSGFYSYTILERLSGWPDVDMNQIRVVFKLRNDKFRYMAISNEIQRVMPTPNDRNTGKVLAYPEAVRLTNPSDPQLKGEVDDKYQYSMECNDLKVHGWISEGSQVGFWIIKPSDEFYSGGPVKQDLTSHVGPTLLSMFTSDHYTGTALHTKFENGEPWKKVFGPIFVYLNSVTKTSDYHQALWQDANRQVSVEVNSWPYDFPQSKDFPRKDERGSVSGQLLISDRYLNSKSSSFAHVGLAAPGEAGSWQVEAKGYQFWTKADKNGNFLIENVRVGSYNLYAWVPGVVGDYKFERSIIIKPGSKIELGNLVYAPPRNGPTILEIGIPDRSAAEFFVPDPLPSLANRLFINKPRQKFRQYGLWQRYSQLYPKDDLTYEVGISNYTKDWFFAHVTRDLGNQKYQPTTWTIKFGLHDVKQNGNYTLQLALASASWAEIKVRFNDKNAQPSHFSTGLIGRDNAIARHGIHGLYRLYSISVPSQLLVRGNNALYLTQQRGDDPFYGVMYDYIRLEAPA